MAVKARIYMHFFIIMSIRKIIFLQREEKFYFLLLFRSILVMTLFLAHHFIFMNLLQAFFIVSGFIISIIAFDIAKRQKFNALHFLVFIGIGVGLFVFTIFPSALEKTGHLFGIQR